MIGRILVPLDGSKVSESVLPYVTYFAKGLGSEVVLVQAVNEPASEIFGDEPVDWNVIQEIQESAEAVVKDYVRSVTRRLENQGVTVSGHVARGRASDVILDYTKDHEVDMVAMSTRGRSGIQRMILGSVASQVLQRSEVPVLLERPTEGDAPESVNFSEVLVPLDMSDHGEAALPMVRELAKALGLKIKLVMALPNFSQVYFGTEPVAYPVNAVEVMEESIREYLTDMANSIKESDGTEVTWETLHGDPGTAVVQCATGMQNNLVAMSSHGRSGLGRMVLGSVTDRVVRMSGDPVLVFRP